MKPFTLTSLTNPTGLSPDELFYSPIRAAYLNSLPPKLDYLHASSIELFFERGEMAIAGDIVQIGPKQEKFCLSLQPTLGRDYWIRELNTCVGAPLIRPVDLLAEFQNRDLEALIYGPRRLCLYTRDRGGDDLVPGLAGIEIVAVQKSHQRVLLLASEDFPGDVMVLTPSSEYRQALTQLIALSPLESV